MIEEKMMKGTSCHKINCKRIFVALERNGYRYFTIGMHPFTLCCGGYFKKKSEDDEKLSIQLLPVGGNQAVASALNFHRLSNTQKGALDYRYFVSDDPHKFKSLSKGFLSLPIENVSTISEPN